MNQNEKDPQTQKVEDIAKKVMAIEECNLIIEVLKEDGEDLCIHKAMAIVAVVLGAEPDLKLALITAATKHKHELTEQLTSRVKDEEKPKN